MKATAGLKALNARFPLNFLSSKCPIILRHPINFIWQLNPSHRRSSFRAFCSLRRISSSPIFFSARVKLYPLFTGISQFSVYVIVKIHDSWTEFREYFNQQEGEKRLLALTKRGTTTHSECSYRKRDYLVFGAETFGLPPEALEDYKDETFGGGTIRILMVETYVRCLNLSVSVSIVLYEAARQLHYEQLISSETQVVVDGDELIRREDIFA